MSIREAKLKAIKQVCVDHVWGDNTWNFDQLAEDVLQAIAQVEIDYEYAL